MKRLLVIMVMVIAITTAAIGKCIAEEYVPEKDILSIQNACTGNKIRTLLISEGSEINAKDFSQMTQVSWLNKKKLADAINSGKYDLFKIHGTYFYWNKQHTNLLKTVEVYYCEKF